MFGNKPGWIVSVLIALAMGGLIWKLGTLPPTTPPSGMFDAYLLSPIELPVKPESVRPIFTEKRDAGDLYWQATQEYLANKKEYDNFFTPRQPKFSRLDNLKTVDPAMKLLTQGTRATEAKIFIRQPDLLVNYRYPYPELEGLYKLGLIAGQIGAAYAAKGEFEKAQAYFDAELSLGKKLFDERINSTELVRGHALMTQAAAYFSSLSDKRKDPTAKAQFETFGQQLKSWYETRFSKLSQVVLSLNAADIRRNAGDVMALATSSPERVWRVEALLKLGRYKYNAGTNADQVWARRYLSEPARVKKPDPAQDADPAVRVAAQLARDLTPEGYNQIDFSD